MKKLFFVGILLVYVFFANAQSDQSDERYENGKEWAEAVKKEITQVSPEDFYKTYSSALESGGHDFILIDIRTESEHNEGFIPGAFLIQRGVLEFRINSEDFWGDLNQDVPSKDHKIVLYCRSGSRSALGTRSLEMLGYTNVLSLEGGWKGWNEKYPNLKKEN